MKICPVCACRHAAIGWECPQCGATPLTVNGIPRFWRQNAIGTASAQDATYRRSELMAAEQWHFWFQARRQLVLWTIDRFLPHAASLFDVGCGTGFVLEGLRTRYPRMALGGCDLAEDALAMTSRRVPAGTIVQAVAGELPFEREFDIITALDVIEHIDDDDEALAGMHRALRPGGGLVLTVPQHPALWSAVDEFSAHRRRYTRSGLISRVRAAGFELVWCTSCFTSTLPIVAALRLRPRRGVFDPLAELKIPRFLNHVLGWLVACELKMITWGLSLPVGGSLLLVARRPSS